MVVRTVGSTVVVPPLEEVFYRSFLYRYLISPEFEKVPLNRFHGMSLGLTCLIFAFTTSSGWRRSSAGSSTRGWCCGKNRIGDAMTAHAITNFLLAAWVVFPAGLEVLVNRPGAARERRRWNR